MSYVVGPSSSSRRLGGPTWHHNRTIIIGDAAHVCPPFGGQGIASGVRDAVGLSWRLALLTKYQLYGKCVDADLILEKWFAERRLGVDDSADITRTNGSLTNQKWRMLVYLQVVIGTILLQIPWLLNIVTKNIIRDDLGYKAAKGGFFLPEYGGGGKVSQIFVQQGSVSKPMRSDTILCRSPPLITILIVSKRTGIGADVDAARNLVQAVDIEGFVVSDESICVFDPSKIHEKTDAPTYSPCTADDLFN